jgi:hypothetical protein
MPAGTGKLWIWIISGLLAYALYRRFRRTFGRQTLRPARLGIRIALLLALGAAMLPAACRDWQTALGGTTGIALGIALGVWAARLTRFEDYDGKLHYIPHTATGMLVSLLILGRVAYRLPQLYAADSGSTHAPPQPLVQTPLTVSLLFLLIGYYVYYYSRVLWKSRHLQPQDFEKPAPLT